MSEDKKADGGGDAGKATRKKGLSPLLMVAIGAALGGAGVAVLAPKPQPTVEVDRQPRYEIVGYEPEISFVFNPRVERGSSPNVRVRFTLDVKQDVKKAAEVKDVIAQRIDRAKSRALVVLMDQPLQVFQSGSEGIRLLTKRLISEFNTELFPTGLATVEDIVYRDVFIQK